MSYTLIELFSYSIFIPAIAGLVRLRGVDQAFVPFIVLLWVGVLNEIVNTVVINKGLSNALNDNIYGLLESYLVLWYFKRQQLFEGRENLFKVLIFLYAGAWVLINFFMFSIHIFSSYFNIFYGLCIVLMSIHHISRLLINGKKRLLQQASFLVAIGFISFFTYKILIEIFWVYGLNASDEFRRQVYRLLAYINLSVNLLYFIAVLWMPKKQEYTLL